MLKKEKGLFIDFIGNTNNLKGLTILLAFFLFGMFYSFYSIQTEIEYKHLVDVYGTNPKIEKGGKELDKAKNGDILDLYSILDENSIINERKSYLTFQKYKMMKKKRFKESFQLSVVVSSFLFVWITILVIRKRRVTVFKTQT